MNSRKISSIILAIVIFLTSIIISTAEEPAHSGYLNMPKLSKSEIVALTRDIPLADTDNFYVTQPSITYPYNLGEVKPLVQQNALTRFNNYRRLAGLGSVTLNSEYTKYAQGAAVVNAANNIMTHYPTKPEDMPDTFFDVCEYGDCHCNIADYWGYHMEIGPLCYSVDLWMDDSDQYNIAQLGHRRWMLNPTMGQTGFGCATSAQGWLHTAVFAFDNSVKASDYDFISWPPSGYMVNDTSFFSTNCAWSISLNPQKYNLSDMSDVEVELENSRGKEWEFDGNADDDGFFNIDLQGYGSNRNAIIFRPDGIDKYDGVYTVTVKGLKNSAGNAVTLVYEVEFFESDDINETTTQTTAPTTVPPTTETTTVPPTTEITTEPTTLPPTTETTTELTTLPPVSETTTESTTLPPTSETTTDNPVISFITGDLNDDKKVNASDARLALRISAQLIIATPAQAAAADVNHDGKVNAIDARKILRVSAQLDKFEPVTIPETTTEEENESSSAEETTIAAEETGTEAEKTTTAPDEEKTTLPTETKTTQITTETTTKIPVSVTLIPIVTKPSTENTTEEITTADTELTTEETTTEERITSPVTSEITTKPLPNNEIAVVISDNSNEYHDLECTLLIFNNIFGDNIYAISKKEAESKGYVPCSKCCK